MVKKCPHCNHYISDTVTICPHCGNELIPPSSESTESSVNDSTMDTNVNANIETPSVEKERYYENVEDSYEDVDDSAGILMKILCFMLPIVGLVLYFVKRNSLPNAAKSYLIWAAAGFGLSLLVNLAL
jgi:hypothetical protein